MLGITRIHDQQHYRKHSMSFYSDLFTDTTLEQLDLRPIADIDDLSQLANMTNLKQLKIDITNIDNDQLQSLEALTQLTSLALVDNSDVTDLVYISHMSNLAKLSIVAKELDASDVALLTSLKQLKIKATKLINADAIFANDQLATRVNVTPKQPSVFEMIDDVDLDSANSSSSNTAMLDMMQLEPTIVDFSISDSFHCPICDDDCSIDDLFLSESCQHQTYAAMCRPCTTAYINNGISDNNLTFKCCVADCMVPLTMNDFEMLLDQTQVNKLDKLLLKQAIHSGSSTQESLMWFPCLKIGCEGGVSYDSNETSYTKFTCDGCGSVWCVVCKEPFHDDSNCSNYQQWKIDNGQVDSLMDQMLKSNMIQLCPQCKTPTKKVDGCNHVKCVLCKKDWNWKKEKPNVLNQFKPEEDPITQAYQRVRSSMMPSRSSTSSSDMDAYLANVTIEMQLKDTKIQELELEVLRLTTAAAIGNNRVSIRGNYGK